jgi:hypothetical protein
LQVVVSACSFLCCHFKTLILKRQRAKNNYVLVLILGAFEIWDPMDISIIFKLLISTVLPSFWGGLNKSD